MYGKYRREGEDKGIIEIILKYLLYTIQFVAA
jgi:hypothetical protein